MSSVCISNCVSDARDPRVPVRATYVNLYKWPESDAEFVRRRGSHVCGHPRVVDSVSCRQMYLRSYKFSRKETVPEKTQKCFGKVKERVKGRSHHKGNGFVRRRKCLVWRKMREISCAAFFKIFRRFLSCSASVDVLQTKSWLPYIILVNLRFQFSIQPPNSVYVHYYFSFRFFFFFWVGFVNVSRELMFRVMSPSICIYIFLFVCFKRFCLEFIF